VPPCGVARDPRSAAGADDAPRAAQRAARRAARRMSLGIVVTVVVLAFETLAVATIGPRIARDLGGDDLYGWLFSAYMLANLVGIVVAGHEADRRGPATVFTVGIAVFATGLLLAGLADSMLLVVLARAVQGFGSGALYNAAYVAIGTGFPESERPRQFALLSSAWVVPGLLAPALGGLVAEVLGWRWVFLGMLLLVPVAVVLARPPMATLPAGRVRAGSSPAGPALLLAAGAGLVLAGLGTGALGPALVALAVGLPPAVVCLRRLTPPGTLRARPGLPAAVAFRGVSTFGFFGADAFLAFALARVQGLDPVGVGLVLTPATLTWAAGAWVQARWAGRASRRTLATVGAVAIAVAVAGTTLVVTGVSPWVVALVWSVGGLGMGIAYSPTSMVALSEAPPGGQGAASSAVQLTDVLGSALSTGIAGAVVAAAAATAGSRRDALVVVFTLMTVAAVAAVGIARRFPPDPPGASHPTRPLPTARRRRRPGPSLRP
jgi:MFS family permease